MRKINHSFTRTEKKHPLETKWPGADLIKAEGTSAMKRCRLLLLVRSEEETSTIV